MGQHEKKTKKKTKCKYIVHINFVVINQGTLDQKNNAVKATLQSLCCKTNV